MTLPGPAAPPSSAPVNLLRQRDFMLYLAARFIASFGQQMLIVAVGWELYERTHSSLALGLVGLTNIVPMFLFTLPAGHVADNFNRKHVMLWMTSLVALGSLSLAAISASGLPVEWTYGCLFLTATARTFLWPASASFLPQLVGRDLFPRAVAWSTQYSFTCAFV